MQHSKDRTLTTTVGSLPRADDLWNMIQAKDRGEPYDHAAFQARVKSAVAAVVRKQVEVGIDIPSDGEQSKNSFTNYVKDRLRGLEGVNNQPYPTPPDRFPEYSAWLRERTQALGSTLGLGVRPTNIGELGWSHFEEVETDIANFKAALEGLNVAEAFLPAVSPGQVAFMVPTENYSSDREYLYALADVLKREYEAIVNAGFILQVDSPDVPMMRNRQLWNVPFQDYRKHLALRLEALNHAIQDIPREKVRFHICWGNFDGPHAEDVPLKDILDLVLTVKAGAYSVEAANHRHAHEWELWQNVNLPEGTIVITGVIDSVSTFVEHPELVAQRIVRFAKMVGRENVIAAPDCGFGTFSTFAIRVHPEIMWAKFEAMVEGARIATKRLWGASPD
jgi:5-methyltetrahydropteroyltriglutamate--homocysteine methyltransferase